MIPTLIERRSITTRNQLHILFHPHQLQRHHHGNEPRGSSLLWIVISTQPSKYKSNCTENNQKRGKTLMGVVLTEEKTTFSIPFLPCPPHTHFGPSENAKWHTLFTGSDCEDKQYSQVLKGYSGCTVDFGITDSRANLSLFSSVYLVSNLLFFLFILHHYMVNLNIYLLKC